jgi:hypothetical protein
MLNLKINHEKGFSRERGKRIPMDSKTGDVNSPNAKMNISNTLLNIANGSSNPKSQFVFAVGPGMMIHSTFVVLDNRVPESPVFYLVHNHGVNTYQAKKLDDAYEGFTGYAQSKYKNDSPKTASPLAAWIYILNPKPQIGFK